MGWIVRWPSWHCCSAQPSPRSTRSRPGCRARWYSGHSASQSPAIRGRAAWTFRGRALPYLWENCANGAPLPEHPPGRAVAYTPFYRSQLRDTRAVERVEGLQDDLLFQGGTAKADAEAGVDAWRDLWPSSTKRRRRTGHEARLSRYGCCTDLSTFGRLSEAELVGALREAGDSIVSLVADDDGQIIGHVLLSKMDAPFPALALAPVSVIPPRQRSGIGSALIKRAVSRARDGGWAAIFVLGDPNYYKRFGFDQEATAGFTSPYAGRHFMVLKLSPSLPATTGVLRHAPAFAALD